jgi:hypothetical protein
MKIKVKELKPNPKDTEEYKQGNYYQHIILFEGEVDSFQFSTYKTDIAAPDFIRQDSDGVVIVIYPHPSNVRCVLDKNSVLWAEPCINQKELQALKEKQAKEKETRTENLAVV